MANSTVRDHLRAIGYLLGISGGIACLLFLSAPPEERFLAHGPMNVGHERLHCEYCHVRAEGTVRQEIQANVRYLMGLRDTPADFGYRKVTNEVCLECHRRPNDRHPVYRFFEPRFKEARARIAPQYCISCHLEHTGKRVTRHTIGYCQACHEDTRLKKDPLDVSHEALIGADNWESCLGCHDFHGNHVMKTNATVNKRYSSERVQAYFDGARSPYSEKKHYKAKTKPGND